MENSTPNPVADGGPLCNVPQSGWSIAFLAVVLFVGGVSFYDGYLVVRTGDQIRAFEKNPIGLYLIEYNNGNPSLFLRLKAAGTVIALTLYAALHRSSRRLARPVALGLVLFQTGLLFILQT